jgi:hypothetical protein
MRQRPQPEPGWDRTAPEPGEPSELCPPIRRVRSAAQMKSAQDSYIYWAELFGIYSFATYWVIKTQEISSIGSEKNALEGRP